jgi:hypothetical protein
MKKPNKLVLVGGVVTAIILVLALTYDDRPDNIEPPGGLAQNYVDAVTSYGNVTQVQLNTPNLGPTILPVSDVMRINTSPYHKYYGPVFDRYMDAAQTDDMFVLYNLRNGTTVDYQGVYDIVIGENYAGIVTNDRI